jgi:hypothetical protein
MMCSSDQNTSTLNQGCGSGSGRIRNYLHVRVRIRNLISDPAPDQSAVVFQHTVR